MLDVANHRAIMEFAHRHPRRFMMVYQGTDSMRSLPVATIYGGRMGMLLGHGVEFHDAINIVRPGLGEGMERYL